MGRCCAPFWRELSLHLTQSRLGWGLPPYHHTRRHCVRWGPSSSPKSGHSRQFSAHVYCGCMCQNTTWYGGRPQPRRHCVRRGPSSPWKGHMSIAHLSYCWALVLSLYSRKTQYIVYTEFFLCSFLSQTLCTGSRAAYYTVSEKTFHLWLAITLTHMNGFFLYFWQKCYR